LLPGDVVLDLGTEIAEQVVLLDVRQDHDHPRRPDVRLVVVGDARAGVGRGREVVVGVVVVVQGEGTLLHVVRALHPVGGLPDLLDRRQEQADEDSDDGDDDQQFDQGEAAGVVPSLGTEHWMSPNRE
jgi:hypothetical protein